jgi:predicted HTH domain antitoxin
MVKVLFVTLWKSMKVTIEIPDEIAHHLEQEWNNLPRKVLEILVVQAYEANIITRAEVRRILQLSSRYETDGFLKQAGACLHYDESDFEHDLLTMEQLEREGKLKR